MRFLDELTTPHNGATNMAVDEAILRAVSTRDQPPTLRFYRWKRPTLSLGYAQPFADVDPIRAERFDTEIVRRLTGGRAVLHIPDELTYSIALPEDHPLAVGSVIESYRRISAALLNGLQRLIGVQLAADPATERATHVAEQGAVCFEVPSHYEITAHGKKLIGSAQVRKFGGILQHGAIPLNGDPAAICDVLSFRNDMIRDSAKVRVRDRANTLYQVTERVYSPDQVGAALRIAFNAILDDDSLTVGILSSVEAVEAARLSVEKYAHPQWIAQRQVLTHEE